MKKSLRVFLKAKGEKWLMKMESVDFIPLGQRACMEIVKRFCYFSYPCKATGKDGTVLKKSPENIR